MNAHEPVGIVLLSGTASRTSVALSSAGIDVLARTDDVAGVVRLVVRLRPAAVVVDLDTAGDHALEAIGAIGADAPVLAVSAVGEHARVLAAVSAGAAGYVVWNAGVGRLVDAVRRVAAGEAVFSPGLAGVVLDAHGGAAGAAAEQLTDREADILRLVVEGMTARQIAARLVLSPRTVENHVSRVLHKLALPNRAALVRYAIERGLA